MKKNELFTHYSLLECLEQDSILSELDKLSNDGKIEFYYEMTNERFKLVDLELSDKEISFLLELFYDNDVIPDLGYQEPDEFKDDLGYFEDYE